MANAASGMAVHDDCKLKFMELKAKRTHRFIIYKIEEKQKQVIVEKVGEPTQNYEDFTTCLPADECRYAIYDFDFVTAENVQKSKIFFIAWSPDTSRVRSKMIYASSKDRFKRELDGIQVELQATDPTANPQNHSHNSQFHIATTKPPRKMTNYGTIPTSSSPAGAPSNLQFISRAKERLKEGLGTRRPWRQMFELRFFNFPKSFRDAAARVKSNFAYFQMNYAIIVLVILFLSLLWHPISLIVFIAMMAVWLFLYFLRDDPLVIFGRLISDRVVMIVLTVLTFGLLLLTHATTNILVSLLVGVVVVLIHAAVRKMDDLFGDEEGAGGLVK